MKTTIITVLIVMSIVSCGNGEKQTQSSSAQQNAANSTQPAVQIPRYTVSVVKKYPHDNTAFTQGLEFVGSKLYEGTGEVGQSTVRITDLESGKVMKKVDLSEPHFGEGITVFGKKLYQLTWQSKTGFIYNAETLKKIGSWDYQGEGWGLTHDDKYLIMSDGTNILRFIDPESMETARTVSVSAENGKPVNMLNELEYIEGEIWANVWTTDFVVRIDPASGKLKGIIDASSLKPLVAGSPKIDVLNGIAYDKSTKKTYFTGKNWPYIFEIKLNEIK